MPNEIENFYLSKEEPAKSCLLALKDIILNYDKEITEGWKYGMPLFNYKGKMFCYLWTDKKTGHPYILMVEGRKIDHPALIQGNRSRMKILLIDPQKDIPLKTIKTIFKAAIELYS